MSPNTKPGSKPPVKRAEMDTPVTEPMVIKTSEGGIVSDIAPEADKRATRLPDFSPRFFISGKSTGAIAAISAALEPEIPDTKYMPANKT